MNQETTPIQHAWHRYHVKLEEARLAIETTKRFMEPANRAQAYHCLLEAQAMAYNWIMAPRLDHPRIFTHTAWATHVFTLAGNCPDIIYGVLALDGSRDYRITGRFGDVRLLLMQVFNLPMGVDGSKCTGNYEYAPTDPDGDEISITLSARPQPGNWIPLDASSGFNFIFLRRFLLDWEQDPGELDVELISEPAGYDEHDEHQMAERIDMAASQFSAVIQRWVIGLHEMYLQLTGGKHNTWANLAGEAIAAIAGNATCNYAFLPFKLAADEAIVIEMDVPVNSAFWSFQLVDVWARSLDFMHAQSDLNMSRIDIDEDNKVRVVISFLDPGVRNWLNPLGREEGCCAMRNYRAGSFPEPKARVVPFSDLQQHLPPDTAEFTPRQRRQEVGRRRQAILKLYQG